ncbi:MAG: hypothetical protein U0003_02580 [Vampirovibrionales bacterium]
MGLTDQLAKQLVNKLTQRGEGSQTLGAPSASQAFSPQVSRFTGLPVVPVPLPLSMALADERAEVAQELTPPSLLAEGPAAEPFVAEPASWAMAPPPEVAIPSHLTVDTDDLTDFHPLYPSLEASSEKGEFRADQHFTEGEVKPLPQPFSEESALSEGFFVAPSQEFQTAQAPASNSTWLADSVAPSQELAIEEFSQAPDLHLNQSSPPLWDDSETAVTDTTPFGWPNEAELDERDDWPSSSHAFSQSPSAVWDDVETASAPVSPELPKAQWIDDDDDLSVAPEALTAFDAYYPTDEQPWQEPSLTVSPPEGVAQGEDAILEDYEPWQIDTPMAQVALDDWDTPLQTSPIMLEDALELDDTLALDDWSLASFNEPTLLEESLPAQTLAMEEDGMGLAESDTFQHGELGQTVEPEQAVGHAEEAFSAPDLLQEEEAQSQSVELASEWPSTGPAPFLEETPDQLLGVPQQPSVQLSGSLEQAFQGGASAIHQGSLSSSAVGVEDSATVPLAQTVSRHGAITLQLVPAYPAQALRSEVSLYAIPLGGAPVMLKSFAHNPLAASGASAVFTVTEEARLKGKTLYRVALGLWRGLFSHSERQGIVMQDDWMEDDF